MDASTPPPSPHTSGPSKNLLTQIEDFFELYLVKKAPFQLPPNAKEIIVKIMPWATIIGILLLLPLILLAFGLSGLVFTFGVLGNSFGYSSGVMYMVLLAVTGVTIIFSFLALPGLFKRTRAGWKFVFYAELLSVAHYILDFQLSSVIFSVIGLYILFQVRENFK